MTSLNTIIAVLALVLSLIATIMTWKFNKRQRSLIDSQEKLNSVLLQKENTELMNEKKADVGARIVPIGSRKYKLRIYNNGKDIARNIRLEFPDGNEIFNKSDINEKFPLEKLEPCNSVQIQVITWDTMPVKHNVKIIWTDTYKENNEKIEYLTL